MAGIYYGYSNIPQQWVETIERKDEITELAKRFAASIYGELPN